MVHVADEHRLSQKEILLSKRKKIKIQKMVKRLLVKMHLKTENNEKMNHEMGILIQMPTQNLIRETSEMNPLIELWMTKIDNEKSDHKIRVERVMMNDQMSASLFYLCEYHQRQIVKVRHFQYENEF